MKEMIKLRSPWLLAAQKIEKMFAEDKGISIERDDDARAIILRVASAKKADALSRLMPLEYVFGNVVLKRTIVSGNNDKPLPADAPVADVVLAAFDGNPVVTQVRQVSKGFFRNLAYCVFRKEVVQLEADNLSDINGNISLLWEDVAADLFTGLDSVFYCTSAGKKFSSSFGDSPLGEWP